VSFNNQYPKENKTYAGQAGYDEPKEYFKSAVRMIKSFGAESISLLDVGCANGAFLFYAKKHLNIKTSAGIDISEEQLKTAARAMPDVSFNVVDILKNGCMVSEKYDVVTCLGVISAFDELRTPLDYLLKSVKPGGSLIVFDPVNPYDVDVLMRYKRCSESEDLYRPAFNIRGKTTWLSTVQELQPNAKVCFDNFEMPFDIKKTDDPMRAWTIETSEKERQIMVGTGQLLNFNLIRVLLDE